MANDFHRVDPVGGWNFVRGAARLLVADKDAAFPSEISDIIVLSSGATQYNATSAWTDLGATKTGIAISNNHSEETFDVDQVYGDIDSQPTNWEYNVQTALAEMTLESLKLAWEGSDITTNNSPTVPERTIGFGNPDEYVVRRLAVLYKSAEDYIRAFVFRRVQLAPVESTATFNKTGEQISLPVQFKSFPDFAVADPYKRNYVVIEQVPA